MEFLSKCNLKKKSDIHLWFFSCYI